MRREGLPAILLSLCLCGCQAEWVQKRSNMLSGTVPDLYYGQVLDNLALAVAKPDALPYFGLPAQGSTANTRALTATYTPTWDFTTVGSTVARWILDHQSAAFGGSNSDAQTLQVTPITDPDKLVLLWEVFHLAAGYDRNCKRALCTYYC